ncbi:hypothetical protein DUI87_23703 [Hirundo rustica rustica]|uniref:Murine leukemia virus integrase C-terminal domain-containing protein n=1 Tax=Hirundo rustica rustica TaxID=333673 RepID=A0A3M0JFC5_HIRRU|nr:hypothetical protein DUI87_23703 [Hirundo rustica rustica]
MCEVMPTINEDTPMSQRGSQSSGSDSDSHFEQLMVNMLDERDRLLDTLRETQESLSLAQQRLQDVIYDRDSLQRQLNSALPQPFKNKFQGFAIHKIQPGDKVLIKTWKEAPLTPHWEGPFLVLLTTDAAVRTVEKGWTYSSRVKRVELRDNIPEWRITSSPGDLKLKIHRQSQ